VCLRDSTVSFVFAHVLIYSALMWRQLHFLCRLFSWGWTSVCLCVLPTRGQSNDKNILPAHYLPLRPCPVPYYLLFAGRPCFLNDRDLRGIGAGLFIFSITPFFFVLAYTLHAGASSAFGAVSHEMLFKGTEKRFDLVSEGDNIIQICI